MSIAAQHDWADRITARTAIAVLSGDGVAIAGHVYTGSRHVERELRLSPDLHTQRRDMYAMYSTNQSEESMLPRYPM